MEFRRTDLHAGIVDDLGCVVTGARPISDVTWNEYVQWAVSIPDRLAAVKAMLIYAPANSPSASQRALLIEKTKKLVLPKDVALITGSLVVRGTLTAFSWLAPGRLSVTAYAPDHMAKANAWLKTRASYDEAQLMNELSLAINALQR